MLAVILEEEEEEAPVPASSAPYFDEAASTAPPACSQAPIKLRGVVFGRSVRSTFASIHVARLDRYDEDEKDEEEEEEEEPVLIRIQFVDQAIALRSYFRRFFKLGDLLEVYDGEWQQIDDAVETEWQAPRFVVHVGSVIGAEGTVQVMQRHYWTMPECQRWQRNYLPVTVPLQKSTIVDKNNNEDISEQPAMTGKTLPLWMDQPSSENACTHHNPHGGGGLGKRTQGQYIANFLLHMIAHKIQHQGDDNNPKEMSLQFPDPSQWAQISITQQEQAHYYPLIQAAVEYLNRNGGAVLDAAGGSGHVSMALAMVGVQATVVDPREHVGKLPKRDRKMYRNALRKQKVQQQRALSATTTTTTTNGNTDSASKSEGESENATFPGIYCQPVATGGTTVVPYDSLRAWFGTPPAGYDTSFRHPDQAIIPVINDEHLETCSAIVALHPDEATDAIVDLAVQKCIPFVIVPCCVFFRLFPNRRKPDNEPVSTYRDLLEYLMAKHESIQKTTLPFEGANTILYSYF